MLAEGSLLIQTLHHELQMMMSDFQTLDGVVVLVLDLARGLCLVLHCN